MNEEYPPVQIAHDATVFAESRFGIHYLARLEKVKRDHLDKAMATLDIQKRSDYVVRADEIDGEIKWFALSQSVAHSAQKQEQLRKGGKKKQKD